MSDIYTIVSIEGNIGSGKTTLLEKLREHYTNNEQIIFLKEPVDEWEKIKDENGISILEKFYSDQNKYSFPFQMMAFISRLKILRDIINKIKTQVNKKFIIITERSLHTDKMVFAKMLYDDNKIEHINYQIYLSWFNSFSEEYPVHKVVYVKTTPEKCHLRILKRSRDGEGNIPLDYLNNCSNYHDNMLDKTSDTCICQEQLILDGNVDIYKNENLVNEWICEINKFIKK